MQVNNYTAGTPSYYTELADHVVNIVQKQRAIVYIDFVKDVAIALRLH